MSPTTIESRADEAPSADVMKAGRRRLAVAALGFNATVVPLAAAIVWWTDALASPGPALLAAVALVVGLCVLLIAGLKRDE